MAMQFPMGGEQPPPFGAMEQPMDPQMQIPPELLMGLMQQMQPEEPPPPPPPINYVPSAEEQEEIVRHCNALKPGFQEHAQEKKTIMRTCYAYLKGQFTGEGDLLPLPSTDGNDHDIQQQRPRVFLPVTRQQVKQLYSYLKLTLFPNDEDYFRVRAKAEQGVQYEDIITEGLKYKFKEGLITEKIGKVLYNLCWAGNAAAFPCVKKDPTYEWKYDHNKQKYEGVEGEGEPCLHVESMNPIAHYVDPLDDNPDTQSWAYFTIRKCQDFQNEKLYFNYDKLPPIEKEDVTKNIDENKNDISSFNGLNTMFRDLQKKVDYDLYYLPYIEMKSGKVYRNMLVGVAGKQVLVRFQPNTSKRGLNPGVSMNWTPDVDSGYGTGPVEDIIDLQRSINMQFNYKLESLSRIGNRFIVSPNVDLTNLWGIAGGVIKTADPRSDVVAITGNYQEIQEIDASVATLKAEVQITSGSQTPVQGPNVDFAQQTATEWQIRQENVISVIREVIEHISIDVSRILERLMYLAADTFTPFNIRQDDPEQGTQFPEVDLSIINNPEIGGFTIELIGFNPSQSKQAQIEGLSQIMKLLLENPMMLPLVEPFAEKIGNLLGLKDIKEMILEVKQRMMPSGPEQQAIPGNEAMPGANPDPSMGGGYPPLPM